MTLSNLSGDPWRDFAGPISIQDDLSRCKNDIWIVSLFHAQGFYARRFDLVFLKYDEVFLMIVVTAVFFMLLIVTLWFSENAGVDA